MEYFTHINLYEGKEGTAVTLGKFDSLHRGHFKLIENVIEHSKKHGLKSVVFSFDMGNKSVLTKEERREMLEEKVDCLIQCPFTENIKHMEAESFIKDVLAEKLNAKYIVVGSDFRFGYKASGDVDTLAMYEKKYGYKLVVIEKEKYKDREISSTFIRELLLEGNIELANNLLGHRFRIEGVVEHGKQLGRTLGFPTMNIVPAKDKYTPKAGVYACEITIDGEKYCGIGNVGIKPTITKINKLLVEVYVFGYNKDTYGKNICVEFCAFERSEVKFSSIEKLKEQVDRDIAYGKKYFNMQ